MLELGLRGEFSGGVPRRAIRRRSQAVHVVSAKGAPQHFMKFMSVGVLTHDFREFLGVSCLNAQFREDLI